MLSLKDALRAIRFFLYRGRTFAKRRSDALSAPIGGVARAIVSEVDDVATRVNSVAGGMSRRFLDAPVAVDSDAVTFDDILSIDRAEIAYAQAAYRPLSKAFGYLGAEAALVSEASAAGAYASVMGTPAEGAGRFDQAAALVDEMLRRRVIRQVLVAADPDDPEALTAADMPMVAVFALALWLLAERNAFIDDDNDTLLFACCDVAVALKDDIRTRLGDRTELRALIAAYAEKV
ncbi:hypothetical protein [Bauldia sp.]|uniref:hypothetical protein n=1 Tax=Bauldia sp. TaxID=2575872 RepID=UPI003BAACA98